MASLSARFGNFVQWFKRPTSASLSASIKKSPVTVASPYASEPVGSVAVEEFEVEETMMPAKKSVKESPVDKLQRGYEEMITMMGSVRSHMEQQSQRSERLLSILEGLPEALKSLPESTRNQTRTLEAIQSNLTQQGQHNTRLADALNSLSKSTQRHELAMTAIGQQLDAGQERSDQILGSFSALTGTLGRMSDANEASTGLLRRMAEQESQAAEQVRQLFVRNQKQMTTMSVVSWSLALVALTVAGYVAVSVSKMGAPGALAAPVVAQTPAPAPAPLAVTPAAPVPLINDATLTPAISTPPVLPPLPDASATIDPVTPAVDSTPTPVIDPVITPADPAPVTPSNDSAIAPLTPVTPVDPATETPAAEKPADDEKTPDVDVAVGETEKLVEEGK